jgi:hypothetical protein
MFRLNPELEIADREQDALGFLPSHCSTPFEARQKFCHPAWSNNLV